MPEGLTQFTALGPVGHFVRKPVKGELELPVGKYRIHEWTLERKDGKGGVIEQ